VPLLPERGFGFDEDTLAEAVGDDTKALVLNTPNNPTGKVFTREEQSVVADLCIDHDVFAVTDEVYEHLMYGDREHVSLATLDGMRDRTITINAASKTYSCTGWRVAWAIAPPEATVALRRVHDFLTVGAPHPLQVGVAEALRLPESYYEELQAGYAEARERLLATLEDAGFDPVRPEGAYYIMADVTDVDAPERAKQDSRSFAEWLSREVGLTGVPGGSFYHEEGVGEDLIRFHFAASEERLDAAESALAPLA
jgi:aminotransferase